MISVIVPHFNQEAHLRTCLERLTAQTGRTGRCEIIVVDNGSRRLPEEVVRDFPGVMLLSEKTPGPGPARNRGIEAAQGDILAFIDADCHADSGWLAAIEAAFGAKDRPIIGGDVRLGYLDPAHPRFHEPYEAIYSFRNEMHIAEGYSGTGNLAVRAEVQRDVGPFAGIGVAEDRDWGMRARKLGYVTTYVPAMIVYHPARNAFSELTGKWDRHIAHDYSEKANGIAGKAKWVLRAVAMLGSPVAELRTIATSPRLDGPGQRLKALACLTLIRGYRSYMMLRTMIAGVPKSDWSRG
ncbi:MAG: glycosyltransferase family 2 protein [Defluviimonas sp.]|nr:glycosyltransferase family 2 protein [Defluviimonas sp.]